MEGDDLLVDVHRISRRFLGGEEDNHHWKTAIKSHETRWWGLKIQKRAVIASPFPNLAFPAPCAFPCSIRVTAHYFSTKCWIAVADFPRLEILLQIVPSAAEVGFRCRIRCSRYAFPSPLPHAVQKRGFSGLKLAAFVDRLVLYLHPFFFFFFLFLSTTVDWWLFPSQLVN